MTTFLETYTTLREQQTPRIAIYVPSAESNEKLYDDLKKALAQYGGIAEVDSVFLQSYAAMQADFLALLVVPDLNRLSAEDFLQLSEYVRRGGALLASASDLFMRDRTLQNTLAGVFALPEADPTTAFFRHTVAVLGIKPYISDTAPYAAVVDQDFVKDAVAEPLPIRVPPAGAKFNTTSDLRRPFPHWGTQFAERYEVLRNYDIVTGVDPQGRPLSAAVTFAQNWETGARLCLFAANGENSLLDSANPLFSPLVDAAFRFSQNRVVVTDCRAEYSCYRPGEPVSVTYTVKNFAQTEADFSVEVVIGAGTDKFTHTVRHAAGPGAEITGQAQWAPERFTTDYYQIVTKVTVGADVVSRAENAFVIWDEQVVRGGPSMEVDGTYFRVNGRKTMLTGVNYYESNQGSAMWVKPNIMRLHDDLEQMGAFGINYLRIHYHHAKWFYDYYTQAHGFVPEQYRSLGESYLPTEAHLRTFDAHVYLCQKFGIIYGGDILTLRPSEMGDPRGWVCVQDYLWLPEALDRQQEFLDLLIPRYVNVPGITWDIYNEPLGASDGIPEFYENFNRWAAKIKAHIRGLGDHHAVTVGDLLGSGGHEPVSDYLSPHANFRRASTLWVRSEKPQLYQEAWLDRPHTPEGDQGQLSDMRQALIDTFRTGLAGFAPWQWTEQLAMWQASGTFPGENWDDYLGCCVRGDGTLKPSGRFYRDFIFMINDLSVGAHRGEPVTSPAASAGNADALLHPDLVPENPSTTGEVLTDEGLLTFRSAQAVQSGEHYMLLLVDGCASRGVARGFSIGAGYEVRADRDCDVWFRFGAGDGPVFVTADQPCTLTVRTAGRVSRVCVCEPADTSGGIPCDFEPVDGGIAIAVEPWHTYYWFRLER
jgi:hypothetical protein